MALPRTTWARLSASPMSDVSARAYTTGYGPLCGLWVWRRGTDRWPSCASLSNPSASLWNAWPDGPGWRNNRMAAQHLSRDLLRPSSGLQELAQTMKKKKIRRTLLTPIGMMSPSPWGCQHPQGRTQGGGWG